MTHGEHSEGNRRGTQTLGEQREGGGGGGRRDGKRRQERERVVREGEREGGRRGGRGKESVTHLESQGLHNRDTNM